MDSQRAHDRLRHEVYHAAALFPDRDITVPLIEIEIFHPLLMQARTLIRWSLRATFRVLRLAGSEAGVFRWLAVSHIVLRGTSDHRQ